MINIKTAPRRDKSPDTFPTKLIINKGITETQRATLYVEPTGLSTNSERDTQHLRIKFADLLIATQAVSSYTPGVAELLERYVKIEYARRRPCWQDHLLRGN